MKTHSLLAGALLALAPLAVLLPGCGGGSSGGVLPRGMTPPTATLTSITPTPTLTSTTPTPTLVPADAVDANLTFTASGDSNFVEEQPFYASINPSGSAQNVSLSFATSGASRVFGGLSRAAQGKSYGPTSADIATLPSIENSVGQERRVFTFQGGSIKVTRLEKAFATLTFENAVFAPKVDGGAGGALGTVTVSGTISGPINGDFIGG